MKVRESLKREGMKVGLAATIILGVMAIAVILGAAALFATGLVLRATHPARLVVTVENHESVPLENGRVYLGSTRQRLLHRIESVVPGKRVTFEVKGVDNADVRMRFDRIAGNERDVHLAYLVQGDTVRVHVVAQADTLQVTRSGGHYGSS